jgi:pimeloyl-ACP methyl ester carboxylesterase
MSTAQQQFNAPEGDWLDHLSKWRAAVLTGAPAPKENDTMIATDPHVRAQNPVHYKTVRVNNLDIFYREAGSQLAPAILLLHGFPTSSNMFRNLIPRLAGSFRLVAPDYPGFGQSSIPDHKSFKYSFENLANVVDSFVQSLGLSKYSMYVMDYGAPIGYRLALRHPERIQGLIVQNGNAYDEGLREFWDPIKKYWADPSPENRAALHSLVDPKSTRWQYENGVPDTSLLDPTTWLVDQAGLDRPGNRDIQMDLMHSYATNVPLYPEFQAFFRKYQPPTLIVWGKNDFIFPAEGAAPYRRDLKNVETYLLDTGHFALETHGEEIASRIEEFLPKQNLRR